MSIGGCCGDDGSPGGAADGRHPTAISDDNIIPRASFIGFPSAPPLASAFAVRALRALTIGRCAPDPSRERQKSDIDVANRSE
jgi:hypothetical protein